MANMSVVQMNQALGASHRKLRSPQHQFYIRHRPWEIQPFMIAPVLPGESLENATLQARVVTDPLQSSVVGWWCEHYLFYVKLRDLYARDLLTAMLLKPETDISSLNSGTDRRYYQEATSGTDINYPKLCTEVIVDNYFRNEGETAGQYVNGSLYLASVSTDNALDSAINASDLEGAAGVDQNLVSTTPGQGEGTAAVYTSEIDKALKEWEYARSMKVTDMTFEDWCESFGVTMPQSSQLYKPELLRYSRDWAYPTNTIDPTNGTPRSAVSWAIAMRADKRRYFTEPGFIVGVAVCRPKMYFKNMRCNMVQLMNNAYAWLPPQLAADPYASFVKVAAGQAPLTSNAGAYYIDIKDLFIHGDQFSTEDLTTVQGSNVVALPNAALTNKRYPASTDMDALFVDITAGTGRIKQDGVVRLQILGRQTDTSPTGVGTNKTV